jgi:hypothetical protein
MKGTVETRCLLIACKASQRRKGAGVSYLRQPVQTAPAATAGRFKHANTPIADK